MAGAFEGMVGPSRDGPDLQLITQIATTPTTVLITGESGPARSWSARDPAHRGRRGQPCRINVAAIRTR